MAIPIKSSKSKKYRLKAKIIDEMLGGLKKSIYFYITKSIINNIMKPKKANKYMYIVI